MKSLTDKIPKSIHTTKLVCLLPAAIGLIITLPGCNKELTGRFRFEPSNRNNSHLDITPLDSSSEACAVIDIVNNFEVQLYEEYERPDHVTVWTSTDTYQKVEISLSAYRPKSENCLTCDNRDYRYVSQYSLYPPSHNPSQDSITHFLFDDHNLEPGGYWVDPTYTPHGGTYSFLVSKSEAFNRFSLALQFDSRVADPTYQIDWVSGPLVLVDEPRECGFKYTFSWTQE